MAALTTQRIVHAGTKPTFTAAAASDTAEVGTGLNTFVVYKNTDAAARTVTVTLPVTGTVYTEATPATVTFTLAANTGEVWIPLHSDYAGADGRAALSISATANVTVAVIRADWTL
ncbi:hypothetical protein ACMA1D_10690 [Streptomyces sp. 796.1]|uniref:hypothetical protein n=1 Tax=Streptomyces sp. 796.1 TaxID=3163029 RepID=UPI0039C96FF9